MSYGERGDRVKPADLNFVERNVQQPATESVEQSREARREERSLARKALPYLRATGWINSHLTQSAVDAESRPIPWYRYAAIDFIGPRISPEFEIFEFGSGNSTRWWAERAASVVTVEHDPDWAAQVADSAPPNIEVLMVALERDGDYCRTPLRIGRKFDVLVIDGRDRVNCAIQGLPALKDDGVIIWDDSQRRRYGHGLRLLASRQFKRLAFTGLGPIGGTPGETSVLYRPENCLKI